MTYQSPFRDDQIWLFDNLIGKYLEEAADAGCESGKAYFGKPSEADEVPLCPLCHTPVWDPLQRWSKSGCKHLVFIHDMNTGYTYIKYGFAAVFWDYIYPDNKGYFESIYYEDELLEMQEQGEIPLPDELEYLSFLKFYKKYSVFGDSGVDCGFVSDHFLSAYSLEQEPEG